MRRPRPLPTAFTATHTDRFSRDPFCPGGVIPTAVPLILHLETDD